MSSRDASFWRETVNDEMDSIMSNQTWILVDFPSRSKPISTNGCLEENTIVMVLCKLLRLD